MTLRLARSEDWATFKATKAFATIIRLSILPDSYRRYDKSIGQWYCHKSQVPKLIGLANKFYTSIDTGDIPTAWLTGEVEIQVNHYSTLFLTPDAPMPVVKLVYEKLVLDNHPDHNEGNGNSERLQEVLRAYREICKIKP